jgi:segregation and condensation protein B
MNNSLITHIEALLFALGRPLSRKDLAEKLDVDLNILEEAIQDLLKTTSGRGVVCVDDGTMLELRATGESAALIEKIRKEELDRELGRAGQETIAAILYRGPLTRSEIDFIRGVNSSQILRTLLIRGLIRRIPKPNDERSFLYEPTTELLAELGVTSRDDLPDFENIRARLEKLESAYRVKESTPS